ncbi:unnamed protein product, partial [Pylaiella littoralis]
LPSLGVGCGSTIAHAHLQQSGACPLFVLARLCCDTAVLQLRKIPSCEYRGIPIEPQTTTLLRRSRRTTAARGPVAMEGVDDEENANLLQFGPEHAKEQMSCLSNAEVAMILEKQRGNYEEKDINVTPSFAKTMTYVKRFGSGGAANNSATHELRETLQEFEVFHDGEAIRLHQFEIMQVANLMQADSEVEEVLALIPSMGARLTEEDIDNVLGIVRKHQQSRIYS